MIAEEFVYENIAESIDQLHIKNGENMDDDFPDTLWNTETSDSNMAFEFKGCLSGIYGSERGDIVCSYNYSTDTRSRRIEIVRNGEIIDTIQHDLDTRGSWSYHQFDSIDEIRVYDANTGEFIYSQKREDSKNYIEFS